MELSFLRGLVAAVNPCAFVLLPTYLMYFLGMEGHLPGSQRATVRRALVVSSAVASGFMAVFVAVGVVSEYVTGWIENNAKYATLVIGVGFVVLGVAMLAGFKLPIATPRLDPGERDRTVPSMFVYGIAYAAASISCTLPLFSTTLFGNVDANGWGSGLVNVVAYGAGMALIVTALTIALAVANTTLLGALRRGSQYVDRIAAVLVALSGAYLLYYFWVVEVNEDSSAIVRRVERLQTRVQATFIDHWVVVALVLGAVVAAAVAYVAGRRSDAPAH
ncbi:MAG: cytochrome c biogenesis CcdA family protein [Ilumatobacter sp.]|uniref:cytochrome c biogenesis CcdA family protein n=1 Tax=Ilumatobacter sp. TaxID=1967498 RepID=UPI00261D9C36|nr:cytochrome c biogenesis CcdA family protein [Ilumatobacter sp.]MDJ0769033.1 cytochrome c biogenesis CcdA family protein [Ilumatobacter sp.]